jgi:cyclase
MRKTLILATALVTVSLYAQQDFSKVQMKLIKITDTVYMLQGAGGNIGVSVGEDGIVIIDDQYAPLAPKIKEALKAISNKPVKFVINTHYHGDHTGGNEAFGKEGSLIVSHENARKRLAAGTNTLGRKTPPAPKAALPVVTFNDRATIHVNGEDLRLLHLGNAHTDGDAIIEFTESNVIHMGDVFFNTTFPFIDTENGGTLRGTIKTVEAVLAKMNKDAKVIPGHGALGDKPLLEGYRDALKGTVAIMNEAIQKGKTLEDVQKEKTLVAWSHLATDFVSLEKYQEMLYKELTSGVPAK